MQIVLLILKTVVHSHMRLQRQKNAKSEVMVVGTDAPVVLGVPLSLCADVRVLSANLCATRKQR